MKINDKSNTCLQDFVIVLLHIALVKFKKEVNDMLKEEEKDIKQFYEQLDRITKILLNELSFVNVNGYIIIDANESDSGVY